MKNKLNLILKGEPYFIGTTRVPLDSEEDVFRLIEDQRVILDFDGLREAYCVVDPPGINIQNAPWEILKTLLAHGCPIHSSSNKQIWFLTKKYFPLTYIIKTHEKKNIHLGHFYRIKTKDADDQFPFFIRLVDYPPGFLQYLIHLILGDGGKVLALEPHNLQTVLIESEEQQEGVFGREETIKFLGYQFIKAA